MFTTNSEWWKVYCCPIHGLVYSILLLPYFLKKIFVLPFIINELTVLARLGRCLGKLSTYPSTLCSRHLLAQTVVEFGQKRKTMNITLNHSSLSQAHQACNVHPENQINVYPFLSCVDTCTYTLHKLE